MAGSHQLFSRYGRYKWSIFIANVSCWPLVCQIGSVVRFGNCSYGGVKIYLVQIPSRVGTQPLMGLLWDCCVSSQHTKSCSILRDESCFRSFIGKELKGVVEDFYGADRPALTLIDVNTI